MAFYAVRNGKKTGIFTTWEECRLAVSGYSGAEYKKLNTMEDAETYMKGGIIQGKYVYAVREINGVFHSWEECQLAVRGHSYEYRKFRDENEAYLWLKGEVISDVDRTVPSLYVDGSYREGVIGFGGILVKPTGAIEEYSGITSGVLCNITGELASAAYGLSLYHGLGELNLIYDYIGIEKWFRGAWSAKSEEAKMYVNCMEHYIYDMGVVVNFCHCKSHSGNAYNNQADKLAKEALNSGKYFELSDLFCVG